MLLCATRNAWTGDVSGYAHWPFGGGPGAATYPQVVLMIAAQRSKDTAKKKLPKRMWKDWLKRLGHGAE